jgi:hypothetical protein
MKTEQAHSSGGTRFRASMDLPRRVPMTIWLNLVCLDAPLVAVAWLWLFARSFNVPFQVGNAIALFLTAWLIYLADRFADASNLKPNSPRSLRQEFCLRHWEIWLATLALVAGFDAYVIWRTTALQTFVVGAIIGLLAVVYLVVNHPLGSIWRLLPAKELAIGLLFAAGTVVALLPRIPVAPGFPIAASGFAVLCALNCISIAGWERELDRAQGKMSIATRHPRITRHINSMCLLVALAAITLAFAFRLAAPIFACLGVSALLLRWLGAWSSLGTDERTALADLVLLTPISALLLASL